MCKICEKLMQMTVPGNELVTEVTIKEERTPIGSVGKCWNIGKYFDDIYYISFDSGIGGYELSIKYCPFCGKELK